jgi:hypothetical protein
MRHHLVHQSDRERFQNSRQVAFEKLIHPTSKTGISSGALSQLPELSWKRSFDISSAHPCQQSLAVQAYRTICGEISEIASSNCVIKHARDPPFNS